MLRNIEAFLTETLQTATRTEISIDAIGYIPSKGIRLSGVTLYKDDLHKDAIGTVENLYVRFSPIVLLKDKLFSPTILIDTLKTGEVTAGGSIGFTVQVDTASEDPETALDSLRRIWFADLSAHHPFLTITKLNGSLVVTPTTITSADLNLVLNDVPCKTELALEIGPDEHFSLQAKLSSEKLTMRLKSKKEDEVYKIQTIAGSVLNSSFNLMGELSLRNDSAVGTKDGSGSLISLFGNINLDLQDMGVLMPAGPRKTYESFNLHGMIENSLYFKRNFNEKNTYELGIKSKAEHIGIKGFTIHTIYADIRIKDGVINVPIIKVQRNYYDVTTGNEIAEKEEFIESLTHDSFIIQIPLLRRKYQTEVEQLLSVFDQRNVTSDIHILNVREQDFPEKYRALIRRLQRAVVDSDLREKMDIEDEILEELKDWEREVERRNQIIEEDRKLMGFLQGGAYS